MSFFNIVEGEAAIIRKGGVYKHVPLATRDGLIYAVAFGGYIQLYADQSTSVDKVRLDSMSWSGWLIRTAQGKLATSEFRGGKYEIDKITSEFIFNNQPQIESK